MNIGVHLQDKSGWVQELASENQTKDGFYCRYNVHCINYLRINSTIKKKKY